MKNFYYGLKEKKGIWVWTPDKEIHTVYRLSTHIGAVSSAYCHVFLYFYFFIEDTGKDVSSECTFPH